MLVENYGKLEGMDKADYLTRESLGSAGQPDLFHKLPGAGYRSIFYQGKVILIGHITHWGIC